MFAASRWARAFLAACKDKREEGLAVLAGYASARCRLDAGAGGARRLEEALYKAAGGSPGEGAVAALRTAVLLVKRGRGRHIRAVLEAAKRINDEENKILDVRVDSASPLSEEFIETLCETLRRQTSAREVRINSRLMPELIAGCRLSLGSDCLDASLRGQLHKMAADLHAAGNLRRDSAESRFPSGGYSW